jgi:hypothetical protein
MGAYVTVADAAKCEDVRLLIKNSYKTSDGTPRTIKIVDLKYYDYDKKKYRNKCILNTKVSVGDKSIVAQCLATIGSDLNVGYSLQLKYVGGEDTKFKVYFKHYDTSWSSKKSRTTGKFQCIDTMEVNYEIK